MAGAETLFLIYYFPILGLTLIGIYFYCFGIKIIKFKFKIDHSNFTIHKLKTSIVKYNQITWFISFSVIMVFVRLTGGSFGAAVDTGAGVVNIDESFDRLFVAFRHCRYVVLETSRGMTKIIIKEKYQAIKTAIVTT